MRSELEILAIPFRLKQLKITYHNQGLNHSFHQDASVRLSDMVSRRQEVDCMEVAGSLGQRDSVQHQDN